MALSVERQFQVFARDRFTCQYCGWHAGDTFEQWYISGLEVDHLIPSLHGGTDDEHNLITACHACNHYKGNLLPRSVDDARQWLRDYRERILRPWFAQHVAASQESRQVTAG